MDTKALKKQMGAAIAMVLVAAIALGSATFAWFVTNNKVDATTSTISAQSNAAFMYIHNSTNMTDKDKTSAESGIEDAASLFPAHWVTSSESSATGNYKDKAAGKFYTAFGSDPNSSVMKASTLALVKCDNDSQTEGTPEAAETGITVGGTKTKYAVKNVFYTGSKGANLSNLVVDGCSIVDGAGSNAQFDDALRVLVVCGNNWVLCNKSGVIGASNDQNKLADAVTQTSENKIDMYVFYDGDAEAIKTNNLSNLKDASKSIKVNFTATSGATDTNVQP